jgi:hypothetical protein
MLAATQGYGAGILTQGESRVMIGLPPDAVGLGDTGTGSDIANPDDPNAQLPDETGGPNV